MGHEQYEDTTGNEFIGFSRRLRNAKYGTATNCLDQYYTGIQWWPEYLL